MSFLKYLSRKFEFDYNLARITGSLNDDLCMFMRIFCTLFLEWEVFQTKFEEKMKTHISCSYFFFFEIRAIYEIMWKNIIEPNKPQVTIK